MVVHNSIYFNDTNISIVEMAQQNEKKTEVHDKVTFLTV